MKAKCFPFPETDGTVGIALKNTQSKQDFMLELQSEGAEVMCSLRSRFTYQCFFPPLPDYIYCTALLTKANFSVTVRDTGAARLNMQLTDKLHRPNLFSLEKLCSHSNGLRMSGAAVRPPTCIQGRDILQFNH